MRLIIFLLPLLLSASAIFFKKDKKKDGRTGSAHHDDHDKDHHGKEDRGFFGRIRDKFRGKKGQHGSKRNKGGYPLNDDPTTTWDYNRKTYAIVKREGRNRNDKHKGRVVGVAAVICQDGYLLAEYDFLNDRRGLHHDLLKEGNIIEIADLAKVNSMSLIAAPDLAKGSPIHSYTLNANMDKLPSTLKIRCSRVEMLAEATSLDNCPKAERRLSLGSRMGSTISRLGSRQSLQSYGNQMRHGLHRFGSASQESLASAKHHMYGLRSRAARHGRRLGDSARRSRFGQALHTFRHPQRAPYDLTHFPGHENPPPSAGALHYGGHDTMKKHRKKRSIESAIASEEKSVCLHVLDTSDVRPTDELERCIVTEQDEETLIGFTMAVYREHKENHEDQIIHFLVHPIDKDAVYRKIHDLCDVNNYNGGRPARTCFTRCLHEREAPYFRPPTGNLPEHKYQHQLQRSKSWHGREV